MEKDNDNPEKGKLSLAALLGPKIRGVKLKENKTEEHLKPVFHLCHFKRLRDDEDSSSMLQMKGTFIQVVFHDKKQDIQETKKEGKDAISSFDYRINSKKPQKKECQLRSERIIWESEENYITKSTHDVLLPLEIAPIFTMYPFTIYKAEASVELVSKILENVTYRPNIAINTKDLTKNFTIENNIKDLDKSRKYDFITHCPSVQYLMDGNGKCCKKFSVDFLLIDDGTGKFIKFYLPFFLVCIISSVNALYDATEHDGIRLTFAEYIQTSSTMALAFVFIIPEAAETTRNQFLRSVGCQIHMALIILGLMFASFPPSFKFPYQFPYYKIGICFLWLSFCFPIYNLCSYYFIRKRMKRESCKECYYNQKGGEKFKIEEIKENDFVTSLSDNFKYPKDKGTDEVDKEVYGERSKGFLYRRPPILEGEFFAPFLITSSYLFAVFFLMKNHYLIYA